MSFTGNENNSISLQDASELTARYREMGGGEILGGYISRNSIMKILSQPDCVGIRYYYGTNENGNPELVIVGVKASEDDLYDGEVMERAILCPPVCAGRNPLNS
jgi:hypothetical protein